MKSPHGVSGGATIKLVNFLVLQKKKGLTCTDNCRIGKIDKGSIFASDLVTIYLTINCQDISGLKTILTRKKIIFKLTRWTMECTNL